MKQLVNVLLREIIKQVEPYQSNIVRIEGIDNPLIYQNICQKLDIAKELDEVVPKITREKYDFFVHAGKPEWEKALSFLHQGRNTVFSKNISGVYAEKSFVDFNNAITKWRNESANHNEQKTTLILLMGTEVAPDTGGLADTSFVISPKEIIANLSKDYSAWFDQVIENNGIHEDYRKAIHTFYKVLFSQISTDIFKLSDFIDSLDELSFSSVQEIIAHICETLNDTWNIPSIIDKKAVPKVSALNKGTMNSAKILTSSIKFIDRADDIPTSGAIHKLHQKFIKYATEQGIDTSMPFPESDPQFNDYGDFEKTVVDFMQGVDLNLNRQKLLRIDFAIVNAIIGTKLPKMPKEKIPTYSGAPIEAYARIFLDTFQSFHSAHGMYPVKIQVSLDRVSMSDCTEDEKPESYMRVCNFVGGILRFLNELTIDIDGQILKFDYDNDVCEDPFDFENYSFISSRVKTTGKWGDPCKIQFGITASSEEESHKYEYRWAFSPYAPWLNAFTYLTDVFHSKETTYVLPTLVSCANIQDYLDCESGDEFYAHLQQFRGVALYEEHKAAIRQYFTSPITGLFDLVCNDFKNFTTKLIQNGFFNAGKEVRALVKSYTDLMRAVCENYSSFTDVQREKIALLVDLFTISSNKDIINNGDIGEVIVPAYNPIMLEKIDAQQLFLRRGFEEIIGNMMSGNYSDTALNAKFNNLIQLSAITQAADVIRRKTNEYLICKNMWEYFGVYFGRTDANDLLSSSAVGLSIVTDDEDATAMLQYTPMSNIIVRNVLDYVRTFPARIDGLNVAFVAPTDMQHIVAAIHAIAKQLDNEGCPATINIKIVCINSKKNSAAYLRRWLDSYFSDEKTVKVNTFLHNSTVNMKEDVHELNNLLINYDLCFTYHILQSSGVQFDLSADEDLDMNYEKFPMTFTPDTIPASHGKTRRVNISQFQFLAAKQHTQTSHMIGHPHSIEGLYRVYRTLELPEIQEAIIDVAHSCCKWVVCIDQAIDRHMLETTDSKIIGFTTGEGSYGELNVTVSARKDILVDIKQMLRRRITEKFANWDAIRLQKAVNYCVDELSQYMDGSRILKALNPYDYEIHSFLAYILTMQILGLTRTNDDYIVRTLISLDSYKHWFAEDFEINHDNKRPDFMLIEIPYTPENVKPGTKLHINAKIIECKMGFQNDNHIVKAKTQLEKGLRTMALNWRPEASGVMHRYWLNQLYRSITFSPLSMDNTSEEYNVVRDKIYGILNGEYEINWTGDIFAFWLDTNDEIPDEYDIHLPVQAEFEESGIVLGDLICHNYGQMFIQKMLLPEEDRNSTFSYNNIVSPGEEVEEEEEEEEEEEYPKAQNGSKLTISTSSGATIPKMSEVLDENEKDPEESTVRLEDIRVLLGRDRKNIPVYWEFGHAKLANRHILITGTSGQGKTYAIQAMILELARQSISSVVFDYTDGFLPGKLEPEFETELDGKITQEVAILNRIPVNPFRLQVIEIPPFGSVPEKSTTVAGRISDILKHVYSFGDQQAASIYSACKRGIDQYGNTMDFAKLRQILEDMSTPHSKSVLSKMTQFFDMDLFDSSREFNWQDVTQGGGKVTVIQLTGLDRELQTVVTEIMLWDAWYSLTKFGNKNTPFVIVLDEAQNLSFKEKSPAEKILREGRKYGWSAWFATQFLKGALDSGEISNLQQAAERLYFKPTGEEMSYIADQIAENKAEMSEWLNIIKSIQKGQCVVQGGRIKPNGQFDASKPTLISVSSFAERQ